MLCQHYHVAIFNLFSFPQPNVAKVFNFAILSADCTRSSSSNPSKVQGSFRVTHSDNNGIRRHRITTLHPNKLVASVEQEFPAFFENSIPCNPVAALTIDGSDTTWCTLVRRTSTNSFDDAV